MSTTQCAWRRGIRPESSASGSICCARPWQSSGSNSIRVRARLYHPKDAYNRESVVERFEPTEFLARLLQHVPAPRLHQLRYFGRYSSVVRARRAATEAEGISVASAPEDSGAHGAAAQIEPDTAERRRLRRLWASMIRRVYEVDPLICRECGGEVRVLAFILQPVAIRKIVSHLERQARLAPRGPPATSTGRVRAAS